VETFAVMPPLVRSEGLAPDATVYSELSLVKGLTVRGYDGQDIKASAEYLQWKIQMVRSLKNK